MLQSGPLTLWRDGGTVVGIGRQLRLAVIGQRLNPTGRPALAAAIVARDPERLQREARRQVAAGAVALDVNAYLPDDPDEPAALRWAVEVVAAEVTVPLCLDSASPLALLAALEACPGKPLVNSINATRRMLEELVPPIRARGAAVVALPYDEGGIPLDAMGRLKVAAYLCDRAVAAGLPLQDVIIDCLAYPASVGLAARETTLRTIRLVTRELGVATILGAGNVGHGSPHRAELVTGFLIEAMEAGLSCAIADPLLPNMMAAVKMTDLRLKRVR